MPKQRPIRAFIGRRALIAAVCAIFFSAQPAAGQVFNFLDPIVDISPTDTNIWVDRDVSAWVPAGATGVILQVKNESSSDLQYGVRNNGSTDTWMVGPTTIKNDTHSFFMIGVDANRIFELYQQTTQTETFLLGYTTSGVTFFTNAVDKSLSSPTNWYDIDISADTAGTAIGAIFIVQNTSVSLRWDIRMKGSTDSFYEDLRGNMSTMAVLGVDANEVLEMKVENTSIDAYLVGYITSGAVFFTNGIDKSLSTTGSYVDVDITPDIGSDDAGGAIVLWAQTTSDRHQTAVRKNGATYDYYKWSSHLFSIVALDDNNLFEGKIDDTVMDFYLLGYTLADVGYAVGNSGTILKTTNGGSNWTSQTSGTTNNFFAASFPADARTGYAVASNGDIRKTTDGGANWVAQTSGTTEHLWGVDFPVDASTGYVTGMTGTILKTTDGGTNWNPQTSGTTELLRSVHFPVDATTGYAVGSNGTILKTTDGGGTWNAQSSGTGMDLESVCFPADASTGYTVGQWGTILKTTDGGANWNAQTSGTAQSLHTVYFPVDATTGYTVGGSGTILKTTDGGTNWTAQTSGTSETLQSVNFPADATTGYAAGWNGTLLKTTDGGTNWSAQTSGTTQMLRGVYFPAGAGGGAPVLALADHDAGQQPDAFTESGSEDNAELFGFKLDPGGQSISVTQVVFTLSSISGLTDFDWVFVDILEDTDGDGDIDVGELTTVGGSGSVDQGAGTITFSISFNVTAATNYVLLGDFPDLSVGDAVTISLESADITAAEVVSGSTSPVSHQEIQGSYGESFQAWSAATAATWQVQDLSGAPFNVPANAVVEIAVRNTKFNKERSGGVRAFGSVLERRFPLHEAEAGGTDIVVMHVQADGSSQIEHYAQNTADIQFILLGYWQLGTYVEDFRLFNAGADISWQVHNLGAYGVGSSDVAEIVMINNDPANEWEAGIRRKGSSLERRLDLVEAEMGGVDTATMLVRGDGTVNAAIEVYAESDWQIDFYLVGYWSTPPRSYRETFVDIGGPSASGTWQAKDLTSFGVPADAMVEIVLANMEAMAESQMGVRQRGSSVARLLDIQEAEGGGADFGRMHVTADAASTIEIYHENIANAHAFLMTGYWGEAPPRIISWQEIEP